MERRSLMHAEAPAESRYVVEMETLGQRPVRGRSEVSCFDSTYCSGSVVVSTGKWFTVGSRRGKRSIPVKPLPVAAQPQKEPKSCASANFATSANL